MTAGLSQAVNVNQLPTQGVERIDVTDTITAFAEFGYYMADSTMQRQPLALNGPTSDKLMLMPVDNPYGSRFYHVTGAPNADGTPRLTGTPRTVGFTQMTLAGLAPEVIETDSDVLRFTAGLKGELGETWPGHHQQRLPAAPAAPRCDGGSQGQQCVRRGDDSAGERGRADRPAEPPRTEPLCPQRALQRLRQHHQAQDRPELEAGRMADAARLLQ
jgi:hypothetical protein